MPHISHDDLAWRAVEGARVTGTLDEHLRDCAACAAELQAFERTVQRIRDDAVEPAPLPPGLWDRIAAELDADAEADARPAGASSLEAAASAGEPPRVRARRRRLPRRVSLRTLVAACVATAIVVGGGVGIGTWIAQRPPAETVVASIALDPLESGIGPASASIVERDGHRVLVIDADALPQAAGGTLDVWLIDADVEGMVNVGTLDADHAEYVLPDDLDLDAFPIVDVSIEPLDGDPTHSGESVWRGSLA
ncbi:anti-sigma factor [Agrococcus jejuensis]|uniref:Anti-sigma-K factor rskA n=1 Tax=Agrococcus jejuensis TaxID=399736 RepID=A0A1G8DLH4_9MICO|nr:anti-sigma factor [Agrococcus jejuensis]SDH58260.1 Anti-sigma-K factor rskA [Agrococcus jejuensis]